MLQVLLVLIYVCLPVLLLRGRGVWRIPAAILCLWIPIEVGLPSRMGVHPFIMAAVAVSACLFAFRSRKDVLDLRASFNPTNVEWKRAAGNFLIFALIAIPLGLAIGFIRPLFDPAEISRLPWTTAVIFLFNALPEEILFRALIQNGIEKYTGSRLGALILAATIFGVSHLNNGQPIPNYKYALMASIAGVFYGLSWRSRRNVLTSSITHTFVNTSWNLFFR